MDPEITSLQNPHIKSLLKLSKRSERDKLDSFAIEGYRPITRALDQSIPLTSLYYCPSWFLGSNEPTVVEAARAQGTKIIRLGKEAFAKAAYRDRPEGLLAVARQWQRTFDDLQLSTTPLILVVESIEKPGNLGTILRSADAAGVDAVVVCDPVTDLFNPNVVRSSTGVLFSMPTVVTTSQAALAYLRTHQLKLVATSPDGSLPYTQSNMKTPLALIMGSEQFGLSQQWLEAADETVYIPMMGRADSLNVAMATLITLFEAVRQRVSPK